MGAAAKLLDAARNSPTMFRDLDGINRFHLYLTACGTGFRAAELAALTPESFAFDEATATLAATDTKNRKAAVQPLPADPHRFIDGKPMLARPIGFIQLTVKRLRRRPTLATLVLTLLVASVAVLGIGLWGNQERHSRRASARHEIENRIPRAYQLAQEEKWRYAKLVLTDVQRCYLSRHSGVFCASTRHLCSLVYGPSFLRREYAAVRRRLWVLSLILKRM